MTETEAASQLTVRLHPFLHQVSGSTLMFKFDNYTICKPLLPKEYHFYKFLPESLREFTARYKGQLSQSYPIMSLYFLIQSYTGRGLLFRSHHHLLSLTALIYLLTFPVGFHIYCRMLLGSIEIKSEEESDGTVVFYAIVPPAKINSLNLASEDGYREGSPTHALDFLQEDE